MVVPAQPQEEMVMSRVYERSLTLPMPRAGLGRGLKQAMALLGVWHERWRQRSDLDQLSARELADIGLTRAEVLRERGKFFWMA